MAIQRRKFKNGNVQLHIDAKLNYPARQKLERSLSAIALNPKTLLKALPQGFCNAIEVSTENLSYIGRKPAPKKCYQLKTSSAKKWTRDFSHNLQKYGYQIPGRAGGVQVINIKGVGKVKIGSCAETLSEYNHLSIDLDPTISEGEASEKLQILFAAIGLGAVSSSSRAEDVERIKTLQLFRAFYPRQAYQFEKNPQTFEESIESLKRRISNQVPDMMGKLTHYLINHPEDMYQQEVYPGQKVWAVRGISKAVKKAGGIGLMAGVTASDFYDATGRLVSLLKSGALSTQDRFQLGIIAGGASSQEDLITGGAGSVFLPMVTNNMPKELDTYPLAGHIQILYDLDLVERVGYAYSEDLYGSKTSTAYQNRLNIINLTTQINTHPLNHLDNEICINHRVGPEFIKGLIVKSEKEKQQLIVVLKHKGLTTKNASHQDCFNRIPLDQFIRVGIARPDYWN